VEHVVSDVGARQAAKEKTLFSQASQFFLFAARFADDKRIRASTEEIGRYRASQSGFPAFLKTLSRG
jgi:hypothetical protein